jgi:hypothetical protein
MAAVSSNADSGIRQGNREAAAVALMGLAATSVDPGFALENTLGVRQRGTASYDCSFRAILPARLYKEDFGSKLS